jgi:hypothetical protein
MDYREYRRHDGVGLGAARPWADHEHRYFLLGRKESRRS